MIVFDGVSLNSVANVEIEDIRVSPIKLAPVTRSRAIRFGSEFVRMGGGERTITITFALLNRDMVTRNESLLNISTWAKDDKEYKLELPTDPERYLMCVCTSKPEPSARQWWESKLRLVFTCFSNPYWNSKAEKSVACGTQFVALGDAPPLMRIERTLSASVYDESYTHTIPQTGSSLILETMSFDMIQSGDFVIDMNAQTVTLNGSSIMQYYKPSSRFIVPISGKQLIVGTGTVVYRERWQ